MLHFDIPGSDVAVEPDYLAFARFAYRCPDHNALSGTKLVEFGGRKRSFLLLYTLSLPSFLSATKHFSSNKMMRDQSRSVHLRWRLAEASRAAIWRCIRAYF